MEFSWIICCSAKYDEWTYCHKPQDHDGPNQGAWWTRKKDGTPDNRYHWNMEPDKEWDND